MYAQQPAAQLAGPVIERLRANLGRVIIGKRRELDLAIMALMARGHILIEDVPGVGKTMLARAIARSIGGEFKRIQFTPDLLPTDIIGSTIYNQRTSDFEFRPGPVMAEVVLADEINRASPKTQAALLECMEERQISVDGVAHQMPSPFIVLATQNPIEYEGTFPLPETELDRFLVRLYLGYPSIRDEIAVVEAQRERHPIEDIERVLDERDMDLLQRAVREVHVDPLVSEYIVRVVDATRSHANLYLGASPRGSLALYRLVQARALLEGRDHTLPDDVKDLASAALGHRLILSSSARIQGVSVDDALGEVLDRTPVPGARPV